MGTRLSPLAVAGLALGACQSPAPADPPAVLQTASDSAGSSGSPRTVSTSAAAARPQLPMEDLQRGATSAITDLRLACIRDASTWAAFWAQHAAGRLPVPEAPAVDWENRQVVALVLGQRNSGGYGVEIRSVEAGGSALSIQAVETLPEPDMATTMALTSPFHFVHVDRSLPLDGGVQLNLTRSR